MPLFQLGQCRYGGQLWVEARIVGSYSALNPKTQQLQAYPKYELVRTIARVDPVVKSRAIAEDVLRRGGPLPRQPHGVLRLGVPELWGSGVLEFRDSQQTERDYTLLRAEQVRLRDGFEKGIPPYLQLAWEREVHGPMSPTLEQEVTGIENGAADGLTFTISTPTANNLLVIVHGHYWTAATPTQSASTGFTHHVMAADPTSFRNTINMLSKIATGSEGTSLVITNGGTSQENSGHVQEWSGMETTSYTDGFDDDSSNLANDVTSQISGSITTTNADDLLIAGFGMETGQGALSNFAYTNSFVQDNVVQGVASQTDHASAVASRVVSSTGTYSTTQTHTTACICVGVIGAFKIATGTPPVVTDPGDATWAVKGVARAIPITVVYTDGTTVTLRFQCTEAEGDGTVTLSGSATISAGTNGTHDFTVSGSITDVTATALTYTYTPTVVESQDTAVVVTANDGVNSPVAQTFTVTLGGLRLTAPDQATMNTQLATVRLTWPDEGSSTVTILSRDTVEALESTDTSAVTVGPSGLGWPLRRRRRWG